MKHFTKAFFIITLVCTLFLCGCNPSAPEEKTFTSKGLTVTLTDEFQETSIDGFTVVYSSSKIALFALKEEFSHFEAGTTLAEYADLVIKANGLNNATVETKEGLTCFTYESTVDGVSYSYFASVFQGTDAFWLVQFSTETSDFEASKDAIVDYAKTVTVA